MAPITKRSSLLAHVADYLSKRELLATRSLAYILESSDAAKVALQEMLCAGGAKVGTIERVEAEVFRDNQGRVDLVAFDEAGEERVLIEAKFSAGLTDNQPEGYLDRLPDDNEPAVLLFLAPQRRLHTLWSHLQQRAREGLELNVKNESGDLYAATIAESNRHLMLTSWQKLLGKMEDRADLAGDGPTGEDIRQLSGLCDQEDTAPFQPLREAELSPEVPRRLHDLMRLVNDAITIAVAERFANKDGKNFRHSREGFGTYLRIGSEDNGVWSRAWFGVEYDWWQEDEYPLWIWFLERSDTLPMSEIVQKLGYDEPYVWIDLPIDKEYDDVLRSVVDDLRKHARRLAGEMDDDEWAKYMDEKTG